MECIVTGAAHWRNECQSSAHSMEVSKSRTNTKREQGNIVIRGTYIHRGWRNGEKVWKSGDIDWA